MKPTSLAALAAGLFVLAAPVGIAPGTDLHHKVWLDLDLLKFLDPCDADGSLQCEPQIFIEDASDPVASTRCDPQAEQVIEVDCNVSREFYIHYPYGTFKIRFMEVDGCCNDDDKVDISDDEHTTVTIRVNFAEDKYWTQEGNPDCQGEAIPGTNPAQYYGYDLDNDVWCELEQKNDGDQDEGYLRIRMEEVGEIQDRGTINL